MITLDQAKHLCKGDILIDNYGRRWRVNGAVKTWKRDPNKVRIPVKHGLYDYGYINQYTLSIVTKEATNVRA